MFLFARQILSLYSILNQTESVENDVHQQSERIMYGSDVRIQEFPYYASLVNCGAAILSESWVVTAAHCVAQIPSAEFLNVLYVAGESFWNSKMVTFDRIVIHNKEQIGPIIVNDIALLHLSEPLTFTDRIRPVDLPAFKDLTRSKDNSELVLAARGYNENGYVSRNLQKMDLIRLSSKKCLSYMPYETRLQFRPYAKSLEKVLICGKRAEYLPGLCYGDSGSPLTQGNTLVGLVSSFIGETCDVATLGFYVNVAKYVPWIKSVTGIK